MDVIAISYIRDRLKALRDEMLKEKIDAVMIPTNDFHSSEYVGEYFKAREFITGFTGSVGTAVVTIDKAALWVDGRYYVQANSQLKETGIQVMKMGVEGVPSTIEFIMSNLDKKSTLAFDGKVVSARQSMDLKSELAKKEINVRTDIDLIGRTWKERPQLCREPAYLLEDKYSGVSFRDKLSLLRDEIKKIGATLNILTSLDDIAWLFNIRGNDVKYSPVVLSYCVVTVSDVILFIQDGVLSDDIKAKFSKESITILPYNAIYDYVSKISKEERILLDLDKVNFNIYNSIPRHSTIIENISPVVNLKAIKNNIEIENIREAHRKDGAAMVSFIYWLKQNVGRIPITEMSAADYLEERRKEQFGYLGPSFHTISAYKDNAALPHYIATTESNKEIHAKGLYLIDAGGQYYEGTTDITRTIALGELSDDEILHYTLVLKGMIRLSKARFRYGCKGQNLDYLARGPLWENNLDYNHGTGHGVGYMLNVHEPPNFIHWKSHPDFNCIFEEGMLTSNEPGYYEEGSHGVRIENLILCKKSKDFNATQLMEFETVTLCPIDKDAIDISLLDKEEIDWLNDYHERVYEAIVPRVSKEEALWLREATKKI